MKLRTYQSGCVDAVFASLKEHASTLAVLATGLGKTVIFSHVADRWESGRVLVLAHREELIHQAAAKIEAVTGEQPHIEMADLSARDAGIGGHSRFIVASVQSLCRDSRLLHPVYRPELFGLVVVDEAHHCVPSNKTYGKIITHFRQNERCKLLGVTATPDRADNKAMGSFFDSVAFNYGIREGIKDGYLVPIDQQYVTVEGLDFSQVKTTAGDLNEGDLERILTHERMLHRVVSPTVQAAAGRPTLIFAVSVNHAEKMAEILNRHKEASAICLHGKTDRKVRKEELRRFADGQFQFLVGCGLFLEGFDCPPIACVAMARPTKSRSLYAQAVGRGTRVLPGVLTPELEGLPAIARLSAVAASGKPRLLVLDFVGNAGRHKLISTADILGGTASEGALERARQKAKKSGRPASLMDEIERSEEELAEEAQQKADKERQRADKCRRDRERIKALATYRTEDVDPFGDQGTANRSEGYRKNDHPPSDKQAKFLAGKGIDPTELSKQEASKEISRIMARKEAGLCSPKQERILKEYGENPNSYKEKASVLIDLLKARGWRPRDYALTRDRLTIMRKPEGFVLGIRDTVKGVVVINQPFSTAETCREYYQCVVEPPHAIHQTA